jgi:hypothetical protein
VKTESNDFGVHHVSASLVSDISPETLIGMGQDKRGGVMTCAFDIDSDSNSPEVPPDARECLSTAAIFPETLQVFDRDFSPLFPMKSVESWSKSNGRISILRISLPVCHLLTPCHILRSLLTVAFYDLV